MLNKMPSETIYFGEETYEKILKSKRDDESVKDYIKRMVKKSVEEGGDQS